MFKKLTASLYLVLFIMNSSYAGGESDLSSKTMSNSNLYGAYTLSFGELDWRSISTFANEPNLYQPVSIDGWIGKRLSEDTEGIIRSKLTYFGGRTGNTSQPEDDAVRSTFNIEILHLRHYESSTSFLNLGYYYVDENESGYANTDTINISSSLGYVTDSLILGLGAGTTEQRNSAFVVDELVFFHIAYKLPITSKFNLIASKHYSEYQRKLSCCADSPDEDMDITGLKLTYDLENSLISFGGDRYTIDNSRTNGTNFPKNKGGSVYLSWTIPIGGSSSKRTNFIMENRPALEEVLGFGAALN